jgi:hypothetical protein
VVAHNIWPNKVDEHPDSGVQGVRRLPLHSLDGAIHDAQVHSQEQGHECTWEQHQGVDLCACEGRRSIVLMPQQEHTTAAAYAIKQMLTRQCMGAEHQPVCGKSVCMGR